MSGRRWAIGSVLAAGLLAEFSYALLLFPLIQHHLVFDRHLPVGYPGYALAAYGVARLVTQVPLGGVADGMSRRLAVTLGYAVVLVGGLALWLPGPIIVVLGAAALFGAGHALADPLLPAALSDSVAEEERGRVISLLNLTQVAGLAAGLTGGAFLVNLTPSAVGFIAATATNGLALLLLAAGAAPLLGYRPSARRRAGVRTAFRELSNERALDIFLVLFLLSLAMNVVLPNIDLYSVSRLHEPLHELVPFIVPAAILGVAALPLGGYLSDRYGRLPPLLGGAILAAAGFLLLALAHHEGSVAVGAALAAVGLALTMPASNVAVLDIADVAHRALVLSGMMAVQGLGQAVGPLLGGVAAQRFGAPSSFLVGTAALLLCVPATVLFASTPHDGEPGQVVTYTPLTRWLSRANIRRHQRKAARETNTAGAGEPGNQGQRDSKRQR